MNALTGNIPSSLLASLTLLESLQLNMNRFSQSVPTEIGLLTALSSLNLANNMLGDVLPTTMGLLSMLTSLNLVSNQFGGVVPTELQLLTSIIDMQCALQLNCFSNISFCPSQCNCTVFPFCPTSTPSVTVTTSAVVPQRDSSAISFGAIGASAAGGVLLVLIVAGVIFCVLRRGRRQQRDDATSQLTLTPSYVSGAFPTPPQIYAAAPMPDNVAALPVYGESSLSST